MRGICRAGLTLALVLMVAGPALAQRQRGGGGFGGFGGLLRNESVQKELKINEEQAGKVKEALTQVQEKHRDSFAKLRDVPREERGQKMQEITRAVNEDTLKAVGEILNADQVKRLKQIELQQAGAQAYARAEIQKALKITDEQKEKIKLINDDAAKQMRELFQPGQQGGFEKMAALRKETATKIEGVLTDDQKKEFKGMTGEPFKIERPRRPANNQ
jgi:Spy/CpxP family protein refolding chaperone